MACCSQQIKQPSDQEQSALSGSAEENPLVKTERCFPDRPKRRDGSESPWRHWPGRHLDELRYTSWQTSLFRNLLIIGLSPAAWEQAASTGTNKALKTQLYKAGCFCLRLSHNNAATGGKLCIPRKLDTVFFPCSLNFRPALHTQHMYNERCHCIQCRLQTCSSVWGACVPTWSPAAAILLHPHGAFRRQRRLTIITHAALINGSGTHRRCVTHCHDDKPVFNVRKPALCALCFIRLERCILNRARKSCTEWYVFIKPKIKKDILKQSLLLPESMTEAFGGLHGPLWKNHPTVTPQDETR